MPHTRHIGIPRDVYEQGARLHSSTDANCSNEKIDVATTEARCPGDFQPAKSWYPHFLDIRPSRDICCDSERTRYGLDHGGPKIISLRKTSQQQAWSPYANRSRSLDTPTVLTGAKKIGEQRINQGHELLGQGDTSNCPNISEKDIGKSIAEEGELKCLLPFQHPSNHDPEHIKCPPRQRAHAQECASPSRLENLGPLARKVINIFCYLIAADVALHESSARKNPTTFPHMDPPDNDWKLLDCASLDALEHLARSSIPLIVFTAATSTIYRLNARSHYQDWFILGGIIVAVLTGMAMYQDLQDAVLKVVPWGILGGLASSRAVHRIWEWKTRPEGLGEMLV